MSQYIQKYQNLSLNMRKRLDVNDIQNHFSEEEIENILNKYNNMDTFISLSLQENEFQKRNLAIFTLCTGCPFYDVCKGNIRATCEKNTPPVFENNVEFSGDEKVLKWFYLNTLLFLNEFSETNRIVGSFYNIFLKVTKITLRGKFLIMYGGNFLHYERVKNATFLSYQGRVVEEYLVQIMKMITGKEYEFYLDNSVNETEIKSPIEERMFNALNNHPYLRKKFNYSLEKHYIYTNDLGHVLFELDMLMTVNNKIQIAIECDGYNYHSDPHRFDKDRERDRTLLKKGILTVRFSSNDINYHLDESISDLIGIIEHQIHGKLF